MSTTIDVYPTISHLPLVEEIRCRTEELFQELLVRHDVTTKVSIKVLLREPGADRYAIPAPKDLRWTPGLAVCFSYWLNDSWDSDSWPDCTAFDDDDFLSPDDLEEPNPKYIGRHWIAEELDGVVADDRIRKAESVGYYLGEYRNAAGPAVSSTGYGLVAAAFAEATDGIILSMDYAFEPEHNGEDAGRFLGWWGDSMIEFYGAKKFQRMYSEKR